MRLINRIEQKYNKLIKTRAGKILEHLLVLFPPVKTFLVTVVIFGIFIFLYTAGVSIKFFLDREEIVSRITREKEWLYGKGDYKPKPLIRVLDRDGGLIGEILPEKDTRVNMNTCSNMVWISRAAVSSEDRYFYEHAGISLRGVARAFVNNIIALSIREGAGSISMQLARNIFTDRSHTLYRKIYETWAAFQLEYLLSKDEILCLYLNHIYMGEGRIGAAEASWYYFRKPPEKLKPAEAAMIVGLFPSPVRYSPQNNILESLKKQKMVMNTLVRDGWLRENNVDRYINEFVDRYGVDTNPENPDPGSVGAYGASRDFRLHHPAPAANEYVREFLYNILDEDLIREGGLTVYTTIDRQKQAAALMAVRSIVEDVRQKIVNETADPKMLRKIASRLNGVMVSIDPTAGDILAVVGGYSISEGGSMTRRVWKMLRQPGSAIKGFLYALAIDQGFLDIDSRVNDSPININGYSPKNWYKDPYGDMSLRKAVAVSSNTVAVKTLNEMGTEILRDAMGKALELGFFEQRERFKDSLTLALGSGETTPLELARLFGTLLNDGYVVRPRIVLKIEDNDGKVLWDGTEPVLSNTRVISGESAARAVHLLRSVIEMDDGTASWIGRARNKNPDYLPFPVAGKSGTVQTVSEVRKKFPGLRGVHDAWFVGMAPGEVDVVWVGQDEGAPFPGGGSSTAGGAWARYAEIALNDKKGSRFPYQEYLETLYDFKPDADEVLKDKEDGGFFSFF